MKTRTITLELLRHGPSHNQLLSPLTPYLALCGSEAGNHDAETIHIGMEHHRFARRLQRALRYEGNLQAASGARQDVAEVVSRAFGSIRVLAAELGASSGGESALIHLRLILSAAELAMLPFELINSPAGFPGEGQPLSLQVARPVVLTREVRRVSAPAVAWPESPRLLVIAAGPSRPVPLEQHEAALREAVAPYLVSDEPEELARHVTFLRAASIADILRECAKTRYTHVHVLAHGAEREDADGELRYGLELHDQHDPSVPEVVSGESLATALRCHPGDGAGLALSLPAMVTVASCDSGNVGSVASPGASVAHALHEAGIPLVLASQFPLSVAGSVVMVRLVYERILRGDDPRPILHDLRQALRVNSAVNHDWASVVAYAALPAELDAQLRRVRFERARVAVNAVMARIDERRRAERDLPVPTGPAALQRLKEIRRDNDALRQRLGVLEQSVLDSHSVAERLHAYGLLASAKKHVAGMLEDQATAARAGGAAEAEGNALEVRAALQDARQYYLKCFRLGNAEAWPLVQYLVLTTVLEPSAGAPPPGSEQLPRSFANLWTTAYTIATDSLDAGYPLTKAPPAQRAVWAHGSLAELFVLAQRLPASHWARQQCEAKAHQHVAALVELVQSRPYTRADFDGYSVLRQLRRYGSRWWRGDEAGLALPNALVEVLRSSGVATEWSWRELIR